MQQRPRPTTEARAPIADRTPARTHSGSTASKARGYPGPAEPRSPMSRSAASQSISSARALSSSRGASPAPSTRSSTSTIRNHSLNVDPECIPRTASPAPSPGSYRYSLGPAPVRFPSQKLQQQAVEHRRSSMLDASGTAREPGDRTDGFRKISASHAASSKGKAVERNRTQSDMSHPKGHDVSKSDESALESSAHLNTPASRSRTQSTPSPTTSAFKRGDPDEDAFLHAASRTSKRDASSSSSSSQASTPGRAVSSPRRPPARQSPRPDSQTLTTFPFPHPSAATSPPLSSTGSRGWLTRIPFWRTVGRAHNPAEEEEPIQAPDERQTIPPLSRSARPTEPDTSITANPTTQARKSHKLPLLLSNGAEDPDDPYGYRALAGPMLLPAFHASRPHLAQREEQSRKAALKRLGLATAQAALLLLALATLAKVGTYVLGEARWPGLYGALPHGGAKSPA
ncbi:hypothetical protein IE81DRAFT_347738 [Ceraceosorus guamensis]|uniref:Uncharacterized protein n=1 Tax=Ceraceosorus guamensis TaxID=1522189 RepID=A0A316VXH5_9BASI|nr:hypothetical protein IE81DRAFT_347738 [Ceraceosorus guamensis]PWN42170.1 hypothetical protein IE81DRAFT_347738 [Ceraceosorus guamensis]